MALKGKAVGGTSIDGPAVRQALAVLADPEHGCQLHGLPSGRTRTPAGNDLDGLEEAARYLSTDRNLYYSLNPVMVGLDHSARNNDVLARRWLLIDLDPVKAEGHADDPATDEEHRRVAEVAQEVMDDLGDRGWPLPVLVDSGNGYHLLYRIDLPANDHVRLVVKSVLRALAPYHGERAKVGFECHDARRIAKLPGSIARKGTMSDDRPFRPVRLLQVPSPLEVVTLEQLQALADLADRPVADRPTVVIDQRWSALRGRATGTSGKGYARSALDRERQRILTCRPNTEEGRNVCLNRAAFNLAGFVASGLLTEAEVRTALVDAAATVGLPDHEIDHTFRSGFAAGYAKPRQVPPRPGVVATTPGGKAAEPPEEGPITIRASEVQPKRLRWLWPGRIPLGKLTTFAGIGGLGKTFVLLDIAARVSRGGEWPNGGRALDGEALFVSGEDDPDDTLVPRLIELGADLRRVRFLRTQVADKFTLADLATLERAAEECEGPLRLVVIDPPTAYLGGVDDHKNAELRALLSPLRSWTAEREASCVFNSHVNKNAAKVEAMARVMGSVAWVNAVRAAHLFARDPDDPDRVLFVPMKNNNGPRQPALAYRIVATGDLATVEWLGEVDTTADAAINQSPTQTRRQAASEWLIERFREQREWESGELFKAAREANVSRNAIFEAKKALGLPSCRKTTNQAGHSSWLWWVPDDWSHLGEAAGQDIQTPFDHLPE